MIENNKHYDAIILGAGLAGMVTALELSKQQPNLSIALVDQQSEMGGLARSAFGGMALIGTPLQKLCGVNDSKELALKDWHSFAEFSDEDKWPKAWAKYYVENSCTKVYHWLKQYGVRFFPVVNWVERGLFKPGNSVPRYHVIWGTSLRLITQLKKALKNCRNVQFIPNTRVEILQQFSSQWHIESDRGETYRGNQLVIASGGITGKLETVKHLLDNAPPTLLNGSHPSADGHIHKQCEKLGAISTHEKNMWNYAAGIDNPQAEFNDHGLSLIPCKTALWVSAYGERIGPQPLLTGFDTHDLCQQVSKQPLGYTWQILNYNIARKELAISGAEHNPQMRDRKAIRFIWNTLTGNDDLLKRMLAESHDFIMAESLDELAVKMNALTNNSHIESEHLKSQLEEFDEQIKRGEDFYTDDQLRRIAAMRKWRADKVRTSHNQTILNNGPLIAIRLRLISRKSLGGLQTNLKSEVLNKEGHPLSNLYAVGEASGFGGGGSCGKRSLEGTFLSACILTAQNAAESIAEKSIIKMDVSTTPSKNNKERMQA